MKTGTTNEQHRETFGYHEYEVFSVEKFTVTFTANDKFVTRDQGFPLPLVCCLRKSVDTRYGTGFLFLEILDVNQTFAVCRLP